MLFDQLGDMLEPLILCAALAAVDGDTARCDGELLRIIGRGVPHVWGVDTAELRTYECAAEKALAQAAHRRLKELLAVPGVRIEDTGARDRTRARRRLVRIWVPTERGMVTAGEILMQEGLAQVWSPGQSVDWCG